MRLKAAKCNTPQEEGAEGIANTSSLQRPVNLSGNNSLGLKTQGRFRATGTSQHSTYNSVTCQQHGALQTAADLLC